MPKPNNHLGTLPALIARKWAAQPTCRGLALPAAALDASLPGVLFAAVVLDGAALRGALGAATAAGASAAEIGARRAAFERGMATCEAERAALHSALSRSRHRVDIAEERSRSFVDLAVDGAGVQKRRVFCTYVHHCTACPRLFSLIKRMPADAACSCGARRAHTTHAPDEARAWRVATSARLAKRALPLLTAMARLAIASERGRAPAAADEAAFDECAAEAREFAAFLDARSSEVAAAGASAAASVYRPRRARPASGGDGDEAVDGDDGDEAVEGDNADALDGALPLSQDDDGDGDGDDDGDDDDDATVDSVNTVFERVREHVRDDDDDDGDFVVDDAERTRLPFAGRWVQAGLERSSASLAPAGWDAIPSSLPSLSQQLDSSVLCARRVHERDACGGGDDAFDAEAVVAHTSSALRALYEAHQCKLVRSPTDVIEGAAVSWMH